jgi:hypothetical protein
MQPSPSYIFSESPRAGGLNSIDKIFCLPIPGILSPVFAIWMGSTVVPKRLKYILNLSHSNHFEHVHESMQK